MSAVRLVVAAVLAVGGYALLLVQAGSTNPSITRAGVGLGLLLVAVLVGRRWIDGPRDYPVADCPPGCDCHGSLSRLDHADGIRITRKTP